MLLNTPNDLIYEILLFLNIRDVLVLKKVCKYFYDIICSNIFWKYRLFVYYGIQENNNCYDKYVCEYNETTDLVNKMFEIDLFTFLKNNDIKIIYQQISQQIKYNKEINIYKKNKEIVNSYSLLENLYFNKMYDQIYILLEKNGTRLINRRDSNKNIFIRRNHVPDIYFLKKIEKFNIDLKNINNENETLLHTYYGSHKCSEINTQNLYQITIFLVDKGIDPLQKNNNNKMYIDNLKQKNYKLFKLYLSFLNKHEG